VRNARFVKGIAEAITDGSVELVNSLK